MNLSGNGVAVSTGIYRDKGLHNGKPFSRRGRFTNFWLNQNGRSGMHCQPIDFDHALIGEDW